MQPDLFLRVIILILQGICTEATFIYVFYLISGNMYRSDIYLCFLFDFWEKAFVEMDSPRSSHY